MTGDWSSNLKPGVCQALTSSYFPVFLERGTGGDACLPVPTASRGWPVHTTPFAASALGGAACNTKGGCGCVGGFPGPPAGPNWLPPPYTHPSGAPSPALWGAPPSGLSWVQSQVAAAKCCRHCCLPLLFNGDDVRLVTTSPTFQFCICQNGNNNICTLECYWRTNWNKVCEIERL